VTAAHRMEERRELRRLERRRRRGGDRRGPVVLQRLASAIVGFVDEARIRAGRAIRGDRPLLVGLVGLLAISGLVLAAPAQSYLDGRARVQTLEMKADALDEANADLEQRAADLQDPLNLELMARETQGFIAPGEVPYSLVPPEVDRPRITQPRDTASVEAEIWYERAWAEIRGWFGG
jgi:cell division protein FtsB